MFKKEHHAIFFLLYGKLQRRKAVSRIGKDGEEEIGGGCHREGPDLNHHLGCRRLIINCEINALFGSPVHALGSMDAWHARVHELRQRLSKKAEEVQGRAAISSASARSSP